MRWLSPMRAGVVALTWTLFISVSTVALPAGAEAGELGGDLEILRNDQLVRELEAFVAVLEDELAGTSEPTVIAGLFAGDGPGQSIESFPAIGQLGALADSSASSSGRAPFRTQTEAEENPHIDPNTDKHLWRPAPRMYPPVGASQVVGAETWLAIDPDAWETVEWERDTIDGGRYEYTATPSATIWEFTDQTVRCDGPGEIYEGPDDEGTDCFRNWDQTTDAAEIELQIRIEYEIDFEYYRPTERREGTPCGRKAGFAQLGVSGRGACISVWNSCQEAWDAGREPATNSAVCFKDDADQLEESGSFDHVGLSLDTYDMTVGELQTLGMQLDQGSVASKIGDARRSAAEPVDHSADQEAIESKKGKPGCGIFTWLCDLWEGLKEVIKNVIKGIAEIVGTIIAEALDFLNFIKDLLPGFLKPLIELLQGCGDFVDELITGIVDLAVNFLDDPVGTIKALFEGLIDTGKAIALFVSDGDVGPLLEVIEDTIGVDFSEDFANGQVARGTGKVVCAIGALLLDGGASKIKSFAGRIKGLVKNRGKTRPSADGGSALPDAPKSSDLPDGPDGRTPDASPDTSPPDRCYHITYVDLLAQADDERDLDPETPDPPTAPSPPTTEPAPGEPPAGGGDQTPSNPATVPASPRGPPESPQEEGTALTTARERLLVAQQTEARFRGVFNDAQAAVDADPSSENTRRRDAALRDLEIMSGEVETRQARVDAIEQAGPEFAGIPELLERADADLREAEEVAARRRGEFAEARDAAEANPSRRNERRRRDAELTLEAIMAEVDRRQDVVSDLENGITQLDRRAIELDQQAVELERLAAEAKANAERHPTSARALRRSARAHDRAQAARQEAVRLRGLADLARRGEPLVGARGTIQMFDFGTLVPQLPGPQIRPVVAPRHIGAVDPNDPTAGRVHDLSIRLGAQAGVGAGSVPGLSGPFVGGGPAIDLGVTFRSPTRPAPEDIRRVIVEDPNARERLRNIATRFRNAASRARNTRVEGGRVAPTAAGVATVGSIGIGPASVGPAVVVEASINAEVGRAERNADGQGIPGSRPVRVGPRSTVVVPVAGAGQGAVIAGWSTDDVDNIAGAHDWFDSTRPVGERVKFKGTGKALAEPVVRKAKAAAAAFNRLRENTRTEPQQPASEAPNDPVPDPEAIDEAVARAEAAEAEAQRAEAMATEAERDARVGPSAAGEAAAEARREADRLRAEADRLRDAIPIDTDVAAEVEREVEAERVEDERGRAEDAAEVEAERVEDERGRAEDAAEVEAERVEDERGRAEDAAEVEAERAEDERQRQADEEAVRAWTEAEERADDAERGADKAEVDANAVRAEADDAHGRADELGEVVAEARADLNDELAALAELENEAREDLEDLRNDAREFVVEAETEAERIRRDWDAVIEENSPELTPGQRRRLEAERDAAAARARERIDTIQEVAEREIRRAETEVDRRRDVRATHEVSREADIGRLERERARARLRAEELSAVATDLEERAKRLQEDAAEARRRAESARDAVEFDAVPSRDEPARQPNSPVAESVRPESPERSEPVPDARETIRGPDEEPNLDLPSVPDVEPRPFRDSEAADEAERLDAAEQETKSEATSDEESVAGRADEEPAEPSRRRKPKQRPAAACPR